MPANDKIVNINDRVSKHDLDIILEVNKKAIELELAAAEQNEEIIALATANNKKQSDLEVYHTKQYKEIDEKLEKIIKSSEETNKDLFKIQVFFITGLLSLVINVIQLFVKK